MEQRNGGTTKRNDAPNSRKEKKALPLQTKGERQKKLGINQSTGKEQVNSKEEEEKARKRGALGDEG